MLAYCASLLQLVVVALPLLVSAMLVVLAMPTLHCDSIYIIAR